MRARYGAGSDRGKGRSRPTPTKRAWTPTGEPRPSPRSRFMIDNLRWAGVPFVLRGGKALSRFRGEIAVHFKAVPHLAFQRADDPDPTCSASKLGPDKVTLNLNVNGPYDPSTWSSIELAPTSPPGVFLPPTSVSSSTCLRATPPSSYGATRPKRRGGCPSRYWMPGRRGWCRSSSTPPARTGPDEAALPPASGVESG